MASGHVLVGVPVKIMEYGLSLVVILYLIVDHTLTALLVRNFIRLMGYD